MLFINGKLSTDDDDNPMGLSGPILPNNAITRSFLRNTEVLFPGIVWKNHQSLSLTTGDHLLNIHRND